MKSSWNTAVRRVQAIGSIAAASLPLSLFAGAGAASATEPTYFYNSDNTMQVIYGGTGPLFVTVVDTRTPRA